MNKDEIKDMVEYCKYSDGCFDCPYNPEDNRSMYALRWYGGCPDCDKELVRAMGKGYRKVADDEQVIKTEQLYETLNSTIESGQRMGYAKGRDETAREILQEIKQKYGRSCSEYYPEYIEMADWELNQIAERYGIELE